MDFRTRLLGTLRAIAPVLQVPGVMVAGSEVPNLLEPDARSTLVVSQDVDIAVPVDRHAAVKARLVEIVGLTRSAEEPSVWLPKDADLIEVNFIGRDARGERGGETYVLEDSELPLLVFGHLSLLRPGRTLMIEDVPVLLPRPAGLVLEKLLTMYKDLVAELRYTVRSGLSTLSLLEPRLQMPDPTRHRLLVAGLLARLERSESNP
jgi:hypothetical protein